jgi:hypothetical protein
MSGTDSLLNAFTQSLFTESEHIKALHGVLRAKIKKSFIELIQEAQRKLDQDLGLHQIEALDCAQRFSPFLYFNYFLLLEGMLEQNIKKVKEIGPYLRNFNINKYYSLSLIIEDKENELIAEYQKKYSLKSEGKKVIFERVSPQLYEQAKNYIFEVLTIIDKTNTNLFNEINELISVIQIFKEYSSGASSSLQYFGMIIMRCSHLPSPQQQLLHFFDTLVHESSHIFLNLLMAFDPIILNSHEIYLSPARQTPRPLKGIFHAHFVFLRLIFMYQLAEEFLAEPNEQKHYSKEDFEYPIGKLPYLFYLRLNAYKEKLKESELIISQHAQLTEFGAKFMKCLTREGQQCLA